MAVTCFPKWQVKYFLRARRFSISSASQPAFTDSDFAYSLASLCCGAPCANCTNSAAFSPKSTHVFRGRGFCASNPFTGCHCSLSH